MVSHCDIKSTSRLQKISCLRNVKKVNKFRLESGHKVREGRGGVYFSKSNKIYMPPLREGVGYMGSKQNQLEKGKGHQKWGGVYKITAQEGGIICWRFYDQSLIKQQGWHFPVSPGGAAQKHCFQPPRKSTGGI